MQIYDGSSDKKAFPTKHTIAVVSSSRITYESNDCMTVRKNGREDWSLFFCESGIMYFDDRAIEPGTIWIYPPETPQKYVAYSKDKNTYRYLHFTGSEVYEVLASLGIKACTPIKVKNSKLILKILDSISLAMCDDSYLSGLTAEYQTLFLISQIANNEKKTCSPDLFKRVLDDMEHSFSQEYDASRYAQMLNFSTSRFNHLFKKQVGQSPYMYILSLRIDNAAALLEETDIKIKDIAEKCGFKDPLYFTQAFKRMRGRTPTQHRKLNRICD